MGHLAEPNVHMHGALLKARCTACVTDTVWHEDLTVETPCPHCGHSGEMRPDVVWFGEMPHHLEVARAGPLVQIVDVLRAQEQPAAARRQARF
jgi:NAD-dependent SIR2 family protein deacetylase